MARSPRVLLLGFIAVVWLAATVVLNLRGYVYPSDPGYLANGWPWTYLVRDCAIGAAGTPADVWLFKSHDIVRVVRWLACFWDILFVIASGIAILSLSEKIVIRGNLRAGVADAIAVIVFAAGLCVPYQLRNGRYEPATIFATIGAAIWIAFNSGVLIKRR